jgi:hypothetical protein
MSFKIKIPLIATQPSQAFKDDLVSVTPKMISKYGSYFKAAALGVPIPIQVLYTIAMVESTGNHYTASGTVYVSGSERSVGIMQISPDGFYESLKKEIKASRLTPQTQAILKIFIPNLNYTLGTPINPTPSSSMLNYIFTALKNPEFNIWAGAITFRRLLEDTVGLDSIMRLDKAIIKYNVGEYSSPTKTVTFKTGDTTALVNSLNPITSSYIVKAVGKNGAMYYYIKNFA